MTTVQRIPPPFRANPKQADLSRAWADPAARMVLISGAIRTGKTQGAGRLLVETAIKHPALYLVARSTYRELEDSTKRAILLGDGDLPPLLPHEVRAQYRAADNKVILKNSSEILFRSLEENNIGKILNLTLGAIFVDQIEEMDSGEAGERLFDTLLGRLSHPAGPRKLLAVANPAARMHWVYRRFVDPETRDPHSRYIHVTMRDNAENLPPGYVEQQEATADSRPAWFRTYVLGEWGAFEGAAYPTFDRNVHIVPTFQIPDSWERFESLDYGTTNPTAVLAYAVDYDGNLIVFDGIYQPGLPSEIAPLIEAKRSESWEARDQRLERQTNTNWADPSIWNSLGVTNKFGRPASTADEFFDCGIALARANNDRRAGFTRALESLKRDDARRFPDWHPMRGEPGSPRLFFFDVPGTRDVLDQIQAAPLETENEPHPGEAVSKRWEGPYGHAHASLRYGLMSRYGASDKPDEIPDDPRAALMQIVERNRDTGNKRRNYNNA